MASPATFAVKIITTMLVADHIQKDHSKSSDTDLIANALRGNQQAYTSLFARYRKMVTAVASRYLSDELEIGEAVQDTFIRAFRALPNFRGDSKFSTWLCRITISVAIDRFRSQSRKTTYETALELPAELVNYTEKDRLEKQDLAYWMRQAMAGLSSNDSTVIHLFYLQERSIEEICSVTGLGESNVKSKLSRARLRLRKVIEEQYSEVLLN
jgi:RNA polymerase sigma factor (sigma-70 family)